MFNQSLAIAVSIATFSVPISSPTAAIETAPEAPILVSEGQPPELEYSPAELKTETTGSAPVAAVNNGAVPIAAHAPTPALREAVMPEDTAVADETQSSVLKNPTTTSAVSVTQAEKQDSDPSPTFLPTAEEMQEEQEKLQQMSPVQRHEFMRNKRRDVLISVQQAAAETAAPPLPSTVPHAVPDPKEITHHEQLDSMTLEQRRDYFEQRIQELRESARNLGIEIRQQRPLGRHSAISSDVAPKQTIPTASDQFEAFAEPNFEFAPPEQSPWEIARQEREARRMAWEDRMNAYYARFSQLPAEDKEACQVIIGTELRASMRQMMRSMYSQQGAPDFSAGSSSYAPGPGFNPTYPPGRSGGNYGQGFPIPPQSGFSPYSGVPSAGYGPDYPPGTAYGNPWGYGY